MSEWISVGERLPEKSGDYLVCVEGCCNCMKLKYSAKWKRFNAFDDYMAVIENDPCNDGARFWMPIPELTDSRWISVNERLPKKSGEYLVCMENRRVNGRYIIADIAYSAKWKKFNCYDSTDKEKSDNSCNDDTRFWMNLPDPPERKVSITDTDD